MRSVVLGLFLLTVTGALGCRGATRGTTQAAVDSPPMLQTGSLDQAASGSRVRIQGRVTRIQDDSPYGHKLWLDDGTGEAQVFIDARTELIRQSNAWRVNDVLLVTGETASYRNVMEVLPKVASDVVVLERVAD